MTNFKKTIAGVEFPKTLNFDVCQNKYNKLNNSLEELWNKGFADKFLTSKEKQLLDLDSIYTLEAIADVDDLPLGFIRACVDNEIDIFSRLD